MDRIYIITGEGPVKKLKRLNAEDQSASNKINIKKTDNSDKDRRDPDQHVMYNASTSGKFKKKDAADVCSPRKELKKVRSLENAAVKEKVKRNRNYSPSSSNAAFKMNSLDYVALNARVKKTGKPNKKISMKANSLQNIPIQKIKTRKRDLSYTWNSRKSGHSDISDTSLHTQPTRSNGRKDTYNLTVSDRKTRSASRKSIETNYSKKMFGLASHNRSSTEKNKKLPNIHGSDSKTKRHIISEVIKYNTKELKRHKVPLQVTQTREASFDKLHNPKHKLYNKKKLEVKRKIKRQVWRLSKKAIKNNKHWRTLLADNHINIDRINIDKLDLSLIDIDALEIENKLLKRAVLWFLK